MISGLYPHQEAAITKLRGTVSRGVLAIMLQAPTGFGKTKTAAAVIYSALAKGRKVLFVVPALSLIDQTIERFEAEGITDIGVIQGAHERTNSSAAVQIASVQTLGRRRYPEFDVLIIDEAHRWFKVYEKLIPAAKKTNRPVIGLSATPWTRGLGKHYDELIIVATTQELIDQGYLSKFRVFAPSHPDLSGVSTVAGDYHEGELADAMNTTTLVADVVTTWLERGGNRPTLCFAVDRAHAKTLQKEFEAAHVPTGYVDAYTDRDERKSIERDFHSGKIKVVCNVGCLTTGVDWDVRCIVLARPTKSEMLFVQIIGRGLRTAQGKDDCIVLDHSDTHLRLGFVTDIAHEALDKGTPRKDAPRQKKTALPKECPKCSYLRPPKVHVCPSCGFKPERQSDVEQQDGELVEFGKAKKTNADKTKADADRKISVYGQLKWIASHNGYKEGWAANKYKAYFGFWPNNYSWAPAVQPEPDILGWVKSKQIAFAKSRGNHARRA